MAILDPVRALFGRFGEARKKTPAMTGPIGPDGQPVPVPDPKGLADASQLATTSQPGQTPKDTARAARYADFDLMDVGDIEAVLDDIVEAALTFEDESGYGFKLDGTKGNAAKVLEEMILFTELREKLPMIARDMVKYGDAFLEQVVGPDGMILRNQTYYPGQIFVTKDEKGVLDPSAAYVQLNAANRPVATWAVDEMIHFKYRDSDREPYSAKSLLDGLRDDWRNLQRLEQGMVTGRVSRAYPRNVHLLDMTNKSTEDARRTLAGYVRAITKVIPRMNAFGFESVTRVDMEPNEDFFLSTGYVQAPDGSLQPRLHDIKLLDPSLAGLGVITDVEYVRRKMFSRVPPDVVGIPTQHADLTNQHINYARLIAGVQKRLEAGLRLLFTRQLILLGIAPDTLQIVWPQIQSGQNWKHQDAKYKQAQTEQLEVETSTFSRRRILIERHGKTEEEADLILTEVEEEKKRFGAIEAPQSRAGQQNTGGESGGSADTPNPSDTTNKPTNRAAQKTNGAGGKNTK